MSLFNLMLLPHVVGACLKWWPKKASDPVDTAALARNVVRNTANAMRSSASTAPVGIDINDARSAANAASGLDAPMRPECPSSFT